MRYLVRITHKASGATGIAQQASSRVMAQAIFATESQKLEPGCEAQLLDCKGADSVVLATTYRQTAEERQQRLDQSWSRWWEQAERLATEDTAKCVKSLTESVANPDDGDPLHALSWSDNLWYRLAELAVARTIRVLRLEEHYSGEQVLAYLNDKVQERARYIRGQQPTTQMEQIAMLKAWAEAAEAVRWLVKEEQEDK